ncbi:NAD(P)/FAD-dependent oxidoreductase [Mesorhizobium sp. BH1-1-5]|uniref:NAD(P)/FAD-dependent oxidoreductase n=1 Tax=Mesorhizobium sp. BH1-1-5 TaxID=2876661 RepID=UPI001CCC2C2E|nr:NAD(P)/FAD-dependent oxidoreductase [Mesorhizobium sp. BH1-1-5]MBZ9988162.1 NAD(P)/FAD-dependent oxidoreductase [Mesorhizobium sp. BH1-1-5]
MSRHRIVVIGSGFGGATLVDSLRGLDVEITLIDRRNHHLFQPLLYQVATAVLSPADIAWPIRRLFRDRGNVTTILGEVANVDTLNQNVILADGNELPYDTLVLATGATHAYFGHEDWASAAPGLKTVEDALEIRSRILEAFEAAEKTGDPDEQDAFLTFAVIGGGPTGVELAGMIAEIRSGPMRREFRRIDTRRARVLLVEAGPRLLAAFPPKLSDYARHALERCRVEVRTGQPVTDCNRDHIVVNQSRIACRTTIWAAGVKASSAALWLGTTADKAGRVIVDEQLSVPGRPGIFAIGDTASVKQKDGSSVPGVAPAAKQQAKYLAKLIRGRLRGKPGNEPAFVYRNQGSLATIGKHAAVVDFGWLTAKGWIAWWLWGVAHIFFLIGVRSRFSVAWNWLWVDLKGQRNARLITGGPR